MVGKEELATELLKRMVDGLGPEMCNLTMECRFHNIPEEEAGRMGRRSLGNLVLAYPELAVKLADNLLELLSKKEKTDKTSEAS